jgi:hypothetical protein
MTWIPQKQQILNKHRASGLKKNRAITFAFRDAVGSRKTAGFITRIFKNSA